MLSNLQLSFAVFLVTSCVAQTEVLAHRQADIVPQNPFTDYGFGGIHPRCSWNCTVIGTDLADERKNIIFKNRLISLVVQYELKVEGQCVNQTLRLNSSGNTNLTEVCQVRLLENNEFPSFASYGMECLLNRFYFIEECIEIRTLCTLKPERTAVTKSPTNYSLLFLLRFARGHLANLGIKFDSVKCKSKMTDILHPCVNISNSAKNNTQSHLRRSAWLAEYVFVFLGTVFGFVFMQYSLVFLCLFFPTVVTENGIREIVLGGASPVSLRSLLGNFFFFGNDALCHKVRTLILRLVVLPFPFLASAIFVHYWFPLVEVFSIFGRGVKIRLFQPVMIICYACYCIQAFYISFFNVTEKVKPCLVCAFLKPNLICNDELPGRILNHLRMQPLILVKSWQGFVQVLVSYFKWMSLIVLPARSCREVSSVCGFLHYVLFILSLATIPVVTVILFLAGVAFVLFGIFLTSPVVRLCSATKSHKTNGFPIGLGLLVLRIFVTVPAIFGVVYILFSASFGYFLALIIVLAVLFCEKCLPFLACLVLVCYYLWSSYSSFTDQYQDLAVTLFKSYKESRHPHFLDEGLAAEQENESNKSSGRNNKGKVVRIPKKLFDMACEELMPIREGVCKLVLKVTSIVCFVFLVFSMIMGSKVGATPLTKALLTFFTGSFPKIAAIYFDGSRQKKLEALITEEEVSKILDDYLNVTSKSNERQDNREINANEVLIIPDDSEENIEMVTM